MRFQIPKMAMEGGELSINDIRHKNDGDNYKKGGGDKLNLCPKCRIVWEIACASNHGKSHPEYYPFLPRLVNHIETCPKCKGGIE
jgi:hypothetical protein